MNTSDPIMAFRMTLLHEHGRSLGTRNKTLLKHLSNMLMSPKIRHFFFIELFPVAGALS